MEKKKIKWKFKNRGKINEAKIWFFVKINKICKTLARFTKKKTERSKINKIRDETGEIIDKTEIKKQNKTIV